MRREAEARQYFEDRFERLFGTSSEIATSDMARFASCSPRNVRRWIQSGALFAAASAERRQHHARIPRQYAIDFMVDRALAGLGQVNTNGGSDGRSSDD